METSISQMMDEKTEELLEQVREELHIMIDQKIDEFRRCLVSGESWSKAEVQMPLTSLPAYFKGKKPVSILYSDGTEIYVDKWKKVAEKLLHRCAEEEVMRERLCGMLGKVFGRDRLLLSDRGDCMDVPLEFYPGMFFEAKFDTESLLKVITTRIFQSIGYDYYSIYLKVKDSPQQQSAQEAGPKQSLQL